MDIWVYVFLIAITAGFVKGVSGFGSSLVSIPLLTLVFGAEYIKEIVVVMVTFNLILNSLLLVEHKGFHPDSLKKVWIIPLTGTVFTIVGITVLYQAPEQLIQYLAAGLIAFAMLIKILQLYHVNIQMKDTIYLQMAVGALSGIGNGIASIDGPPVVYYLTSINAKRVYFKNVLASHFLVMGVVAVVFHIAQGSYTKDIITILMIMIVGTVLGLFVGIKSSRNWNQEVFDKVVILILFFLLLRFLMM